MSLVNVGAALGASAARAAPARPSTTPSAVADITVPGITFIGRSFSRSEVGKDHDNLAELVVPVAIGCPRVDVSSFGTPKENPVRMSLDWWAVLAAAVAVVLVKIGVVSGIPW